MNNNQRLNIVFFHCICIVSVCLTLYMITYISKVFTLFTSVVARKKPYYEEKNVFYSISPDNR